MHRPHLPSQNQNRSIWLQAWQLQARHLESVSVSSPWVPVGQESVSVYRYIYGTGV